MKKLYPMTAEERALAETHIDLVGQYLRRHRLPEADYYDIVIFGYLEAVQTFFRNPIEAERSNFPALARVCMKYSVYDHWHRENAQKRRGETLSLDYLASNSEGDNFSLYAVLFDEKQDLDRLTENRVLLERAHARGNRRELQVMDLIASGYDIPEASQELGISVRKCKALLRSIRQKTERAKAEYREERMVMA